MANRGCHISHSFFAPPMYSSDINVRAVQEKDQEAFRRRYFWAYDTTPDGEGNNATSTKLLILPNGKMMSVERREKMDAACADRPKIGDHRPNQVRRRRVEACRDIHLRALCILTSRFCF